MPEPSIHNPETAFFGVKLGTLVAGFAGGVVSLSFLRGMTASQGVLAVFTGVATAAYMTPLATRYLFSAQQDSQVEYGIAFVIGLTAMNVIPGFLKLSEIFKRDPRAFLGGSNGSDK